jgi:hypothetical protein
MRSQAFSEPAPTVHFSEVPPDIVQDVQVVQAQAFTDAPAAGEPAAGGQVFFSELPPDVTQDVQVVAVASALSAPPPAELSNTIAALRARGVADEEIRQFLQQIGASYTFALSAPPQGVTVTLPGGHLLTPTQSELLLASIAAQIGIINPALGPVILPLLRMVPAVANRFNVTIGIGPSLSGGLVAGASLGAGIMFAPGDRVGFYGTLGAVLGAIVSISATMQVTIVRGGPEAFSGSALAVTIGGGEGIVGSASALLGVEAPNRFLGVAFAMGVGAGFSPIEAYAQYQYTPVSLGLAYAARRAA